MISGVGKYLTSGFYESRGEIFDSALQSFKEDRNSGSEDVIRKLMIDSGFREEDNCCIDLEKEFFDPDGEINREKSDKFKKELILYYSLNHLKYLFSGTGSLMTRITEDSLKREGRDINNYLPIEIRREREKKKESIKTGKDNQLKSENKVPLYIYSDGSLSTSIDKDKSRTKFNILGSTGGSFDFSKGYDPNNSVKDKTFIAGFNKDGVWESIDTNNKGSNTTNLELDNSLSNIDVELLFNEEMLYLLDFNNILESGIEDEYYSVNGELYARREIDKEKSISRLKETISKSNIKAIKTVVLKDDNPQSINYYKENFKEFINDNTIFTTQSDKKSSIEIKELRERQIEDNLSRDIINNFIKLTEENRNPDEIMEILDSTVNNRPYLMELNIFDNPNDMITFLAMDQVKDSINPEVEDFIKSVNVPEDKSREFSRSVQNILNDKNITETTKMGYKDLLTFSYNKIVKNNDVKGSTITNKTSIMTLLDNKTKTVDLNSAKKREEWLLNSVDKKYNKTVRDSIQEKISANNLNDTQINRIINGIDNMDYIAGSTGITPVELVDKIITDTIADKPVYIDTDLNDLISLSSANIPEKVLIEPVKESKTGDIELSTPGDIELFLSSPNIKNRDSEDTIENLSKFLNSNPVPIQHQKEFARTFSNAVKNRENFPKSVNSLLLARTIADSFIKKNDSLNSFVEENITIYKESNNNPVKYNLLDKGDLTSFTNDQLFKNLSLDEGEELLEYLKSNPVSYKNSQIFSREVLNTLNNKGNDLNISRTVDKVKEIAEKIANNSDLSISINNPSNVKTTNKTKDVVPLNYNLMDKQDIEQFKNDPILSSYSPDDIEDLADFLNSSPITVRNSTGFSSMLTNGLRSLPKTVKPAAYASSLASRINREMFNKNYSGSNINLSATRSLNSFINSPTFKSSGINSDKFRSLITKSRSYSPIISSNSSVTFPLIYKTVSPVTSNTTSESPNNIYNQGYVVKKQNGNSKPLVKPISNSKIKDVYGNFGKTEATVKQKPNTPIITSVPKTNDVASNNTIDSFLNPVSNNRNSSSMGFNNPTNISNSNSFNPSAQQATQMKNSQIKTPEQQRMDRIQQNYLSDKENLSREGRSLPTGEQMLAKSKNKDVGSTGTGGGKGATSGRSVKEASLILSDEIKTKINNDLI